MQGLQARHFGFIRRHDEFAANFVRNVILAAESHHLLDAGHRKARFDGTGFVIQTAMQDAAVVPRLMLARGRFLLEHRELQPGKLPRGFIGGSQTDNTAANDDNAFRGTHELQSKIRKR